MCARVRRYSVSKGNACSPNINHGHATSTHTVRGVHLEERGELLREELSLLCTRMRACEGISSSRKHTQVTRKKGKCDRANTHTHTDTDRHRHTVRGKASFHSNAFTPTLTKEVRRHKSVNMRVSDIECTTGKRNTSHLCRLRSLPPGWCVCSRHHKLVPSTYAHTHTRTTHTKSPPEETRSAQTHTHTHTHAHTASV